ncbi:MAG: winged helix-turn-helix transcriptional regulator [Mycolicibacterium sp.]|uniref:winged helix-turn-helix transcriptional regulator n=1 Tax=Mycolicibacterium sp. TaxID=2320850 RepID=UPI003D143643
MLGVLGDEWTLLIIQRALLGSTRYNDFVAALPISDSVLTGRLRSLVAADLLARRQYQTHPPRWEYALTARSRSLWPMLMSIWEWERRWVPAHVEPLPAMCHGLCGSEFSPLVTCQACRATATEKDVVAQWGPSGSWSRSVPATTNRRRSATRRGRAGLLFPQTMSVIGDRWAFALLVGTFVGLTRFTDFRSQLGAPPGTVADRLALFAADGILVNARGRYQLTEKGRGFFPVLVTALRWAQLWYPAPEGPAVQLTHAGCGGPFIPVLVCDQCATELRGAQVIAVHPLPE